MRFTFDGVKYKLVFIHHNPQQTDKFAKTKEPHERYTKCLLEEVDGDSRVTVSEAVAYCHPVDNFDKREGRKQSLTRLLSYRNVDWMNDKSNRTKLWKDYFSYTNQRFYN